MSKKARVVFNYRWYTARVDVEGVSAKTGKKTAKMFPWRSGYIPKLILESRRD